MYKERDQPYIQWDADNWFEGWSSHGVCRIGKFELDHEVADKLRKHSTSLHEVKGHRPYESTVSANQCRQALRKIVRYGGRIRIFFGNMAEKEKETFMEKFPNAEVENG